MVAGKCDFRTKLLPKANVPESIQRARYDYGVATDWQEPNTVNIHALGKAENVAGYIAAHMTKSDSVRPI